MCLEGFREAIDSQPNEIVSSRLNIYCKKLRNHVGKSSIRKSERISNCNHWNCLTINRVM